MTKRQACEYCKDEGWVCENHPHMAWNEGNPECCGGAGRPCTCNKANPPWLHEAGKILQVTRKK